MEENGYDYDKLEKIKKLESKIQNIDKIANERWATLVLHVIYTAWKTYDNTNMLENGVMKPLRYKEPLTKEQVASIARDVMLGDHDVILDANQLADMLQMHQKTIYHLARTKKLPNVRIGNDYRFSKKAIMALFE